MKKRILSFMFLFLPGVLVFAQQRVVEKTFALQNDGKLDMNLRFGDHIRVEAWGENKVSFRAVVEINGGRLNDALLLDYSKNDERLRISADFDQQLLKQGKPADCPDRASSSSVWNSGGRTYMVCNKITYELRVPRRADLSLETISADIEILGLSGPVEAKSISGFVDVSWPGQQGADLSMKTISGEVYSDLDNIEFWNKKESSPLVGYELQGIIGKGGSRLQLESVSGNIYLRKN